MHQTDKVLGCCKLYTFSLIALMMNSINLTRNLEDQQLAASLVLLF